jgi:plastocyanin
VKSPFHFRAIACALGLLWPALMAGKCIQYDKAFDADAAAPHADAATDGAAAAVACSKPLTAQIRVINHSFVNQCGCAESSGKTCTVPAGTTVVWTFADSDAHDITSDNGAFEESGERLVGTFSHQFTAPGSYPYECSIHAAMMSGYFIEVP